MSKLIYMTLLAIVTAITLSPLVLEADIVPYQKPLTVQETIIKYAMYYDISPNPLLEVAKCESTFNPKAYNPKDTDGLPAFGLFQFKMRTFTSYAIKAGVERPNVWNVDNQAHVAAYMFLSGQQHQWGCYHYKST